MTGTVTFDGEKKSSVPIADVSEVVVFGNVSITTPCMGELMQRQVPISWFSYGGWFYGHSMGNGHNNVELRTRQFEVSIDANRCLDIARGLVVNKIRNQRLLVRRNWKHDKDALEHLLKRFDSDIRQARHATKLDALMGVEGAAARHYFGSFSQLMTPQGIGGIGFDFNKRNRRPPTDPVNALLSLAYAMLTRVMTKTAAAIGFDPFRGYLHQPRFGRPSLALDLMEPFRPIIADSVVLRTINSGVVKSDDFVFNGAACALTTAGRKRFISAFEQRLSDEITHPDFGYRLTYRRLLYLHTRLFARYLSGEIPTVPTFTTR